MEAPAPQPVPGRIELPVFSGPLDLLLHLIRKNEVSIYDIPIAVICDQYQETLRRMTELDIEIAGEFISMASWLLQLKSKMLLPRPEEGLEEDPRAELVERLLEYRRVKETAAMLAEIHAVRRGVHGARVPAEVEPEDASELDLESVDLDLLARTYVAVMERFAADNPPPIRIVPLRFTVEEKMRTLQAKVVETGLFPLLAYIRSREDAEEAVTLVVATLELARLGRVRVEQRRPFAEIYLRPGERAADPETLDDEVKIDDY